MLDVSERRACRVLGQHRSTQRKIPRGRPDEDVPTRAIIALATEYGRYGYRRVWGLLAMQGWQVNMSWIERIWKREGAESPPKTTQTQAALAERRIVHPSPAMLASPCLEL